MTQKRLGLRQKLLRQAFRLDTVAIIGKPRGTQPQHQHALSWNVSTNLRGLAFAGFRTHNFFMDKLRFDRTDYSVVVKNRAPPPKAWRWEIYRAGNANQIKQSSIYFDTVTAARRAGKGALKELLEKLFS